MIVLPEASPFVTESDSVPDERLRYPELTMELSLSEMFEAEVLSVAFWLITMSLPEIELLLLRFPAMIVAPVPCIIPLFRMGLSAFPSSVKVFSLLIVPLLEREEYTLIFPLLESVLMLLIFKESVYMLARLLVLSKILMLPSAELSPEMLLIMFPPSMLMLPALAIDPVKPEVVFDNDVLLAACEFREAFELMIKLLLMSPWLEKDDTLLSLPMIRFPDPLIDP